MTQVLLPVWCVPRRGYGVEVVGAALLAAAEGAGTAGSRHAWMRRRARGVRRDGPGPLRPLVWGSTVAEVLLIALVGVAARRHLLLQVRAA